LHFKLSEEGISIELVFLIWIKVAIHVTLLVKCCLLRHISGLILNICTPVLFHWRGGFDSAAYDTKGIIDLSLFEPNFGTCKALRVLVVVIKFQFITILTQNFRTKKFKIVSMLS